MSAEPETRVFQAVITQAGLDATFRPCCRIPRRYSHGSRAGRKLSKDAQHKALQVVRFKFREAMRNRYAARRWLLSDSPDFRTVCELAQVDARYVREGARALADRGWRNNSHQPTIFLDTPGEGSA